ncbi:hypothetical protein [Leucobacter sp.]
MRIDSRLLTLLGVLVIVAVLGLGTVLAGLPMYARVQAAQQEIVQTQATNATLEGRLAELSRAKERRADIEAGIETLREQLPARPESDTVLQVISDALTAHEVFPKADRFGDSVAYAAQTGWAPDGEAVAETPAPAPEATEETAVEDSADGNAAEDAAPAAEAPAEPPADPQQQIEITLEVAVPDEPTATAFLDSLRSGSRLLLVTGATLEREEDQETGMQGKITVTMLSFYRTDDAQ